MTDKKIGVTHEQFDFDGGSCLAILRQCGLIDECIFGEKALKKRIKKGDVKQILVADYSFEEDFHDIDIIIYDHHGNPNAKNMTAFDMVLKKVDIISFDPDRLKKWKKLAWLGDHKPENDTMDIALALKRLHMCMSDYDIFEKWFIPLFNGFMSGKEDVQQGKKIFQEAALQFGFDNPDSPAKNFLSKWTARVGDEEKLMRGSPRNFFKFLIYLDEESGKEWIKLLLIGLHHEQMLFYEDKKVFMEAEPVLFGKTLVIACITSSPTFLKVVRYMMYSDSEEVAPLVREKIINKNSLWVLLQVDPNTLNFQIFVHGFKKIAFMLYHEITKALRAIILEEKDIKIPGFKELQEGGTLPGTEPLYFHRLETGYSCILWGSLKRPAKPATIFGESAVEINERLVEIIKVAIDEEYFTDNCFPGNCRNCDIYSWQLRKCSQKRYDNKNKRGN